MIFVLYVSGNHIHVICTDQILFGATTLINSGAETADVILNKCCACVTAVTWTLSTLLTGQSGSGQLKTLSVYWVRRPLLLSVLFYFNLHQYYYYFYGWNVF